MNTIFSITIFSMKFVTFLLPDFHEGGPFHIEISPLFALCKSMDYFLYDRDIRHERVNYVKIYQIPSAEYRLPYLNCLNFRKMDYSMDNKTKKQKNTYIVQQLSVY